MQLDHPGILGSQIGEQRQHGDARPLRTGPGNLDAFAALKAFEPVRSLFELGQGLEVNPLRVNHPAPSLGIQPGCFEPATDTVFA
ncbi:hypothetical protein GALL_551730 [mine drainage metagenome]|uniref:Uncharacterized protein n=1 Tax=mine drainage metagenome TaxID=410659 RepID=A0A1J5PI97_9ZZZZ